MRTAARGNSDGNEEQIQSEPLCSVIFKKKSEYPGIITLL